MDQYPNEEEEFELMYNDEMDLIDEMHEVNVVSPQPCTSKSIRNFQNVNNSNEDILLTPQLSQISCEKQLIESQRDPKYPNSTINRRLFDTHTKKNGLPKRISSTPLNKNLDEIQELENDDGDLECLREVQKIGIHRKRRLEDLFGDIRDIEDEEFYIDKEAKKQKNEEEKDFEMIEKILEIRRKIKETNSSIKRDSVTKLNALRDFKMKNLSQTVPKYSFIPLVRYDGQRIYVRFHSEQFEKKAIDEINILHSKNGNLLNQDKEKIWNEANELVLKSLTNQNTVTVSDVTEVPNDKNLRETVLWVEKYKPKRYIDLLSDEATNRSLLSWLKMWDKVVFGKEFRIKEIKPQQLNTFNKRTKKFESTGGWNRRLKNVLNNDIDEHGRPVQKVALLCGPPGLGKTTLAHTIAYHAGYSVRELNASDDRNLDAFRLTLENCTQMSSLLNEDKRPNCIVLDEIDGAPQQSIDFLVKFVTDIVVATKMKKGIKKQKNILKRPIICICNDMYTPALRQLRQIAFIVNFPPIESSRLAERLLEIARKENLKTDIGTLLALSEKSGNDIRSCISVMQFFNSKKKRLTLEDVLNSNIGQKDRHRDLFGVWTAIFQIQRPQKCMVESNKDALDKQNFVTMTDMSLSRRFKNILEVIHMTGDHERLMQGVYENYLSQKMPDPYMNGIVEATQWFCFQNEIHSKISHSQNYVLYPYLQFGFVMWHLLFASLSWPKIKFPNKGYEFNQKLTTHRMIFQALRRGITPGLIGIGYGRVILIETIPLLKRILSPNLRSVSLQLLTPKERSDLVYTVNVMVDLGLTFTQIKSADGTYQYQMEPDIDLLCQFSGFQGITLSYFGKQLIAREVEIEKMRRSAPKVLKKKSEKENRINEKKKQKQQQQQHQQHQQNMNVISKTLPNHLQSLKPKAINLKNIKETISKDFFGRVITKQTTITVQEGGTDVVVKSPIWFRYKEGFNNAVRKDICISELL